ncbi:MAG: hypothetical protein QOE82_2096, partial [Thermoanaerobaculia bacterium]|nr:hypothetical protein [Thermoanaerobaculia bacterium]
MRSVVYGILLISSLLMFGCASAFDVYHVPKSCNSCGGEYGHEALFYTLPKTVVTVDATVDKKVVTPGVCEQWIPNLFGLTKERLATLVELPPKKLDDEEIER